ncbi:hypothetical protein SELMODRAFT_448736 [Selaginella moellendorffii]|uniref:DUF7054 domain-containing protein n=1 Tax=Selaginella moellendorffii TaxID=88036 RepID=D8T9U3_SELML|nr:uncharacterized protein LOC9661545 [Selaginella moellendorffii]EFJ06549.1 hypothetical protein SELMODRAFT_448736 [Selaginella moellendorffii]|eukprot:XP_002992399.1 uncharacterized protein LOC9661545 [Selaginella moellendorffii]
MAPHAMEVVASSSSSLGSKGRTSPKSKAMVVVPGRKVPVVAEKDKNAPSRAYADENLSAKRPPGKTPLAALLSKSQGKGDANLMLVTVTVLGSPGPLRFLVDKADTVGRVVDTALRVYAREGRLPLLSKQLVELYCDNGDFKALDSNECIGVLGTRQFLLYRKKADEISERQTSVTQPISHPLKHWWSFMSSLVCSH